MINLNILKQLNDINQKNNINKTKIFYSSSACIYPEYNQLDPDNPDCREESAYPAAPDSEYGWEKLFSEHFILHIIEISISQLGSQDIIIYMVLKVPGMEVERKLLQQYVERLLN